jgi:hypothetical protein
MTIIFYRLRKNYPAELVKLKRDVFHFAMKRKEIYRMDILR